MWDGGTPVVAKNSVLSDNKIHHEHTRNTSGTALGPAGWIDISGPTKSNLSQFGARERAS